LSQKPHQFVITPKRYIQFPHLQEKVYEKQKKSEKSLSSKSRKQRERGQKAPGGEQTMTIEDEITGIHSKRHDHPLRILLLSEEKVAVCT